jgi:asparagine synthase (glutamine-hydrolysing)
VLDDLVWQIVRSQHSRGPDHQAVLGQSLGGCKVSLGHNRLSIIDLSAAAHQPMWDASKRFVIVYNGEIYNYLELRQELLGQGQTFSTSSDTEVILAAFKVWHTQAFEKLNGMFAFALLDTQTQRAWLVRDRFGVKPLFFTLQQGVFAFASIPNCLAKHFGLKPDLSYVSSGIRYWLYEQDNGASPYQGITPVPPGHYLALDWKSGRLGFSTHSYYNLEERVLALRGQLEGSTEQDLLGRLEETLQSAVHIRLRADVPVAVSLSGGLDSSTVAWLSAAEHPQISGFSFAHPEAAESEGPLVRLLEQSTHIKLHYIWPKLGAAELEKLFFKTLDSQGAPFPSLSVMAQNLVYQVTREKGFKVLLGGQGGDEAFMGYIKFHYFYLKYLLHNGKGLSALAFLGHFARVFGSEFAQNNLYQKAVGRLKRNQPDTARLKLPSFQISMEPNYKEPYWHRSKTDVTRYSLPTLLRYEDRNSMGHSIESRLPFMDYRVVELGLALPESLKLRHGYGKWAVRDLMRSRLPRGIWATRYKRGFDVQQQWIDWGLGDIIRSAIQERSSALADVLDSRVDIETAYADDLLAKDPVRLAEAISLVWLGSQP